MVKKNKYTKSELLSLFAKRIAMYEGFYVTLPGGKKTLAQRNNNPGNLRSWGDLPVVAGFVKFPDPDAGFKALIRQCDRNIFERRLTFKEFFCGKPKVYPGYAPDEDNNDCEKYAQFLAEFFGSTVNAKIHELVQ